MKFFSKTLQELGAVDIVLLDLESHAVRFGLSPDPANVHNVWLKITTVIRKFEKSTKTAENLGYSSVDNALKALRMLTNKVEKAEADSLPEVFHKVSNIWLSGWVGNKKRPAFAPMRLKDAVRRHKMMLPLIIEAWQLSDENQIGRDKMVSSFLTQSADDFEKELYRFIYDLEEVTIEEEFDSLVHSCSQEEMEESLRIVTDPNRIYGVVPKDQV
jgi:hypothetical protein